MTFIRPNNKYGAIDIILTACIMLTIVGVIWLIVLYNQTVNFTHKISDARTMMQDMESESAELKERTLAFFNSDHVKAFASDQGLIPDRNPRYVKLTDQWLVASQHSQ